MPESTSAPCLVSSGVPGLDTVLAGGFAQNRIHLVEGLPGSGKTTLGMQFLIAGAARGERGLYFTLSESKDELLAAAEAHGWSLDGIDILELVPPELSMDPKQQQTVLYSADLELGETVQAVIDQVNALKPQRIVIDSLSEIRLLAQSSLRYRRQVLGLKQYFAQNACTVLLLDDQGADGGDRNLHTVSHSVLCLEQLAVQYGAERRRLRVLKIRGAGFRGGFHDVTIRKGGLVIYPRLVASEHHQAFEDTTPAATGVAELDALLGGGFDRGTSTLIMGPAGCGKSSLVFQAINAALERGERAVVFSFDETRRILLKRSAGMGIDFQPYLASGSLVLDQIDPAELSPGELVGRVRAAVEHRDVGILALDSLSGFLNAMPEERFMLLQMHEMLTYLNQRGVVTFLVLAQQGLVGHVQSPIDLTYLSDTVLLLRYFEAQGSVRHAISVMKKRTGKHERAIREYAIDTGGIRIGPALNDFQGILAGSPIYSGLPEHLINPR